jgi:hypothetical protein
VVVGPVTLTGSELVVVSTDDPTVVTVGRVVDVVEAGGMTTTTL